MAADPGSAAGPVIRGQRGFILVTTLWLLAVLTVAATYLAYWTAQAIEGAWREQQAWEAELEIHGTQAAVLYLLGTRRLNIAGLALNPPELTLEGMDPLESMSLALLPTGNDLALDDRPYRGMGSAAFAVQDEGGLVGLTRPDPAQLGALLGLLGIPVEQRGPLIAKLEDYCDADDLTRLNGAEARQYEERSLPAPPNRELLNPWETRAVLDWADYPGLWRQHRLPRMTTPRYTGLPNPNTAPLLNLQTIPGVDAETARRMVAGRPYLNFAALNAAIGVILPVDEMSFSFVPLPHVRLALSHPMWPGRREIRLRLTPLQKPQPWTLDYALDLPAADEQATTPPAPLASPVFAETSVAAPNRPQ
jgi:general secretion pathway protein K